MTENPDVVQSRRLIKIAKEIREIIALDWSVLYAQDDESTLKLRDTVIEYVIKTDSDALMVECPDLVAHLLKYPNIYTAEWGLIAIAIDNQNGMYHPLRLTKVVLGATK